MSGSGIAVGAGGLTVNLPSSGPANVLLLMPLTLVAPQTWNLPVTGFGLADLSILGNVTGAQPLTLHGSLNDDADMEVGAVTASNAIVQTADGASLNGSNGNAVNLISNSELEVVGHSSVGALSMSGGSVLTGPAAAET